MITISNFWLWGSDCISFVSLLVNPPGTCIGHAYAGSGTGMGDASRPIQGTTIMVESLKKRRPPFCGILSERSY